MGEWLGVRGGLLTSNHGPEDNILDIGFPRQGDFVERGCTSLHGAFMAIAGCDLVPRSTVILQSGLFLTLQQRAMERDAHSAVPNWVSAVCQTPGLERGQIVF